MANGAVVNVFARCRAMLLQHKMCRIRGGMSEKVHAW